MPHFDIFGESGDGKPGSLDDVMAMCRHYMEEHDMSTAEALGIIFDMIRPGNSENSHDIKGVFIGAMYAFGYGEVARRFHALYLNIMPWGIGFTISVDQDFEFYALAAGARTAIIESLAVVLRSGGMNTVVADDHILLTSDEGDESLTMMIDEIVSQFTQQMDEELGPSEPTWRPPDDPENPASKWM